MDNRQKEIDNLKDYKYGFSTDIESTRAPKGLNEGKIQMPEYKYTNVNNIIRDIICDNTGVCKC
mgnify:CR=1 FL=1